MSFMNSSKHFNNAAGNKNTSFVNADVADVPHFCNHYQLQISLTADPLVRIAYTFGCKLQNNTVLI